jgi:hypothetical protein
VGERKVDGVTEYKVRWVDHDESEDSWLPEDQFTHGFESTLKHWRERTKIRSEDMEIKQNKTTYEKGKKYKPNRSVEVGSTIGVYSGTEAAQPFYIARVLAILPKNTLKIQWWNSSKIDGVFHPEFLRPKGKSKKGTVGPRIATIRTSSVMDRVAALDGKSKGKVPAVQLKELLRLAENMS